MSYLKIKNVSKSYDNGPSALRDIAFSLDKGEVVSMIGESGSGKSTLLRIIAGLENQDAGEVYLEDKKILNPSQKLVSGYDEIKLIHQDHHLYPNSTVEENIARPLLLYNKEYRNERVEFVLKMLNLVSYRNKYPKQLSGGQQQKIAIGRALSIEPEILLLDEPFSSLDAIQKRDLIEEMRHIFEDSEMTVVFVTHDLDDALLMSNSLYILQKGRLVQHGTPNEIYRKPKSLYTAQLFSHLNPLLNSNKSYIRPSDVSLSYEGKGLTGTVINSQYLIHYNLLTVALDNGEVIWKIEDFQRKYEKGEKLIIRYEEEKVLNF